MNGSKNSAKNNHIDVSGVDRLNGNNGKAEIRAKKYP